MADTSLRVTRRPKGSPRRSLTAASQPITNPTSQVKGNAGALGTARADWQNEAWEMFDLVGELRFYVGWKAGSCSRCRLVASAVDEETGLPTGGIEEDDAEGQRVAEYVRAIADGPLGQADLIKRFAECYAVVGEVWIVVVKRGKTYRDGSPRMEWFALSNEEMRKKSGNQWEFLLPDGSNHVFNPSVDSMLRVWKPRARKAREADSAVRAVLDPLREIVRTSKKIKNAAKSRLSNNGVVFLPEEMSLPSMAAAPIPEGMAEIPNAPVPVINGVSAAEQLAQQLMQAGMATAEDDDAAAGVIPLFATVPSAVLDKVNHLKFGNDITDVEIKTRTDAITRLALGLDVSPERLLGFGNSNHWSMWGVVDSDVQLHIAPDMAVLCQAIYNDILRALLDAEGIDSDRYTLWFDASQLTVDPDLTDEATQAKDRGALRNDVYLQKMGLPEDGGYDLTTLEGAQLWAREAIVADPTLITTLAPLLSNELAEIDFPTPQTAIGDGNAQPGEGQDDPNSEEEPDTEDDAEQDAVTASVRSTASVELILAERLLVDRGLELANKRRVNVRDTAQKARLSGLSAHEWHRVMGPVGESDIPKLIKGWDTGLNSAVERLGIDAGPLRDAVLRSIRRELTSQVIDGEVG